MKKILNFWAAAEILLLVSCGASSSNQTPNSLVEKKAKLDQLKQEQTRLNTDIRKLEDEIGGSDSSASKKAKTILVALDTLKLTSFSHYIDLQGKIDALNIAFVAPRNGTGGLVTGVYVKKGDYVKKGQLLLKLDDAILQKQLSQSETQLSFAEDLYNRRNNLWKQNIGTEVDVINAKNSVDQAQKQINIIKEQINFTNVYADIDGVADDVNIRIGETFTGVVPGTSNPQIRIVNTENLKATVQVPELYLSKVRVGTYLKITLPELNNRVLHAKVNVTGKLIDPNTRSFYIEAKLPDDKDFHPNQIAMVSIEDYTASSVITVPVNTVQNDEKGKYVLVASRENGQLLARKRVVQIGQIYKDQIEIKSGLQTGDVVITDGSQGLYDGQAITTVQ